MAFLTAADEGNLGTTSGCASLSPIVTARLAWIVLKELMKRPKITALVIVRVGTAFVVA